MPGAPGIPPFLPQKQKIFAVHLENIDAGITPNELRDFLGELGHIADVNFNKGYKLYQQAVTDVVGNDNTTLHTEIMYYCRKPKCPKKVWTSILVGASEQIYSRETISNHNHEGSPLENDVDIVVDKAIKLTMQNPVASCRSIIAAATEGISDEVQFLLDTDKICHRLNSLKSKLYPQGQTDPVNLSIPDLWRVHVDGSLFVMYDSGAVACQKRMIIMSSLFMMDKFSTSSSIAADGTFFSRPAGWRQIYAWHLRLKNTFVPAVVVFMGERTERAYTEMLGAISEIIRQNFGREWTVEQVMTDFELAIRLAVRRQFEIAHSKSRYLRLFRFFDRSSQRRPMLQGISVLQRAVNEFDGSNVHMSLAKVTKAAYSRRWNRPTSLRNTDERAVRSAPRPTVNLNVPGINRNLAGRRRRWFNAPVFQITAPTPPRSGGFNHVQNSR